MKLRAALWLALGGSVASSLIAATAVPAMPAAAATSACTMTDLGSLGYGVSLGLGIKG